MSLKDTLVKWNEAAGLFDKGESDKALDLLENDCGDSSKIMFTIGSIQLRAGRHPEAIQAFTAAVTKDEHLAVAYFQRGIAYYSDQNYEMALEDFDEAFRRLRGNDRIDYTQLGMAHKLYMCEVLFNRGLALAGLNDMQYAQEDVASAAEWKREVKHQRIEEVAAAFASGAFSLASTPLYTLDSECIFRPPKDKIASAGTVFKAQKAKVVAAVRQGDNYSGFSGRQLLESAASGNVDAARQLLAKGSASLPSYELAEPEYDEFAEDDPPPVAAPPTTRAPPPARSVPRSAPPAKAVPAASQARPAQQPSRPAAPAVTRPPAVAAAAAPTYQSPQQQYQAQQQQQQQQQQHYAAQQAAILAKSTVPAAANNAKLSQYTKPNPAASLPRMAQMQASRPAPAPAAAPAASRPGPSAARPGAGAARPAAAAGGDAYAQPFQTPTTYAANPSRPAANPSRPAAAPGRPAAAPMGAGAGAPRVSAMASKFGTPAPAAAAAAPSNAGFANLRKTGNAFGGGVGGGVGGGAAPPPAAATVQKLKIKCHYKDTRVIVLSQDASYNELCDMIQSKFNISGLALQYKDDEGDMVLLSDQTDLDVARESLGERMQLWCVEPK
ncbi:neutrophil cytosolic factor 2 [Capsaspora owczarzaki ATCC 30864]|uniref:Neutrophil cytosolic factor 2 n=1 Tax=Capsaspora owczarzaki (strain ATCC 30864) TaxID=595528 RepID=A0A0D2X5K7_CAPO3|nr:neutrophil cytosolic factor 2 [Capsaspora owczarzaki ATCC 30864]KJE97979.1 neutrophil cytosolic factor 2 [Capsaspora owczarzaki ATCC 30864]|eukprot:XP_004342640.1 neutrophil cytosolic factor 2 [Capsaspora owczarzaki ATCC 30864]